MKSYFANSVQLAMEQAGRELGSDATLVTSQSAGPDARHLGEYEVVFATDLPDAVPNVGHGGNRRASPSPATLPAPPPVAVESMLAEIRDLGRLFLSWRQASIRSSNQPGWIAGDPEMEEAYADLIQAEIDPDLVQQLMAAVQKRISVAEPARPETAASSRYRIHEELPGQENSRVPGRVRAALAAEIQSVFRVDSDLGNPGKGPRMVALVGPPGVGKTATIAKLAVKYGLSTKTPTLLISLDTLRVAASEQLRSYASILGIDFQVADTNEALAKTLESNKKKELILIDTPGLAARDLDGGYGAAEFLAGRNDIQKHLVLPASMRFTDLARISSAYDVFRPSRLIFTRMDETDTFGPMLCEAVGSDRPISFFTTGQRVPEDLESADKAMLANLLLPSLGKPAIRKLVAA
jgi:flagellar biosynthesis protein FlhF